eukprot:TRINITY_DN3358_c0_g2_i2.p1 TRINITY_DN3358_c0_g2~~TRINITY_DN3358_c0_g2_i2.p1  ORF type:complete len:185 (+),score=17.46 TRINITY_DN3358_c0_g2_i2:32-586(+)
MSLAFEKYRDAVLAAKQLEAEAVTSKELLDEQWARIRQTINFELPEDEKPSKKPNNSGVLTPSDILDGIRRSLRSVPCVFKRTSVPKYREYTTVIVWYRAELNGEVVSIAWEQSGPSDDGPTYHGAFRGDEEVPLYVGQDLQEQHVPADLPCSGDFSESRWPPRRRKGSTSPAWQSTPPRRRSR